ncbi:nitroreductase family protein [Luteolibacter luteus]|uniref:Nitroreductase family protein n=1 Tax=Luteolibacter luteus TaxID=2728835 RepID=A0A858RCR3_9BACT|nr:nitroreductase family protein [Luteolibacter luteus]QJE94587.1 nitroreductase family protein [Luteolibacter luteus]
MRFLRRLLRKLDPVLARAAARSRLGSSLYYGIYRTDFLREQRSFAAGRQAYQDSLAKPGSSMAILRRNVHRIEKGLLMQPRRVPFALDYIGETVAAFATACKAPLEAEEFAWGRDVLSEYFAVHEKEAKANPHAEKFYTALSTSGWIADESTPRIPYRRDTAAPLPVDLESLRALARHRRSVRWFLQKPVPRSAIDAAIEIGTQAPSACNRQPFEFRIFDDRELVEQVIDIPFGLAGYGHNVPVLIVVVGQQRNFFSERDRHLIYIDASLAVMGLLYGLEVQGLSSCCVNWPDIEENETRMAELLKLSADERPVMLVALGYPDPQGMVARSVKKSLPVIRRYNFE